MQRFLKELFARSQLSGNRCETTGCTTGHIPDQEHVTALREDIMFASVQRKLATNNLALLALSVQGN